MRSVLSTLGRPAKRQTPGQGPRQDRSQPEPGVKHVRSATIVGAHRNNSRRRRLRIWPVHLRNPSPLVLLPSLSFTWAGGWLLEDLMEDRGVWLVGSSGTSGPAFHLASPTARWFAQGSMLSRIPSEAHETRANSIACIMPIFSSRQLSFCYNHNPYPPTCHQPEASIPQWDSPTSPNSDQTAHVDLTQEAVKPRLPDHMP